MELTILAYKNLTKRPEKDQHHEKYSTLESL